MTGRPNYYYTWTTSRPSVARVSTSRTELLHIGLAFLVLTVDLVILLGGGGLLLRSSNGGFFSLVSPVEILAAATAVLTGFLCHELAHKVYAQRHGFWAEFRMSPSGLLFSFLTSLVGFIWAVPGATVVSGMSEHDRKNWGRTSLAGPVTNAVFGLGFYAAAAATYLSHSGIYPWLILLAWFNGWFATFNLFPIGPLDGAKVRRWNAGIWIASLVAFGVFTGITTAVLYGYLTPLLGR